MSKLINIPNQNLDEIITKKIIESEKVILKLSEPNRAGLLIPVDINDNEDITMLVMPVMLND